MDQTTFVARLAARLNINSNDPAYSYLDEYVNEGLHYLETTASDGYPWYRQTLALTTTAGVQSYAFTVLGALATPAVTIRKILDATALFQSSSYQALDLINPETATESYGSTSRGFPEAWYAEGQTFYIYPIPDAAYTVSVRVVYMESDLGGASSTPVLPAVYHTGVIDAALLIAYQSLQDSKLVAQQEARVDQWVRRMKMGDEYASAPRITVRDPLVT